MHNILQNINVWVFHFYSGFFCHKLSFMLQLGEVGIAASASMWKTIICVFFSSSSNLMFSPSSSAVEMNSLSLRFSQAQTRHTNGCTETYYKHFYIHYKNILFGIGTKCLRDVLSTETTLKEFQGGVSLQRNTKIFLNKMENFCVWASIFLLCFSFSRNIDYIDHK